MYTSFLRYMRVRLEDAERCPSWPKEHDWKSCIPQKGIRGSNPRLSATFQPPCGEVAERLNAAVSKTVLPVNPVTRVRIPASPPVQLTSQPGTFFIPVDIAWIRTVRSISVKRTAQWAVRRKSARRLQPKRVIFREAENTESLPLRHLDFKSPCRAIFHMHAVRRPCAPLEDDFVASTYLLRRLATSIRSLMCNLRLGWSPPRSPFRSMESSTMPFSFHTEPWRGTNWGLWRLFQVVREMVLSILPAHKAVMLSWALGNPPRCRLCATGVVAMERIGDCGGFRVPHVERIGGCGGFRSGNMERNRHRGGFGSTHAEQNGGRG